MKLKLTFLICCFLAVTSLSAQSITLFKESFGTQQDHPFPSGWTRANVDNLPYVVGYGVEVFTDAWIALDDQESPTHEIRAFSTSWYESGGTANDWMWTPAIDLSGGNIQLSWQARRFFPGNNSCSYEVRIMTAAPTGTTGNIGNMLSSTVLFSTAGENYALTDRTADLSAYAGQKVYIGFRNTTAVDDILMIDDVTVKTNFAITSPNANTLFSNTAAFSVAENTTVVTTVAATDEAGGNLSYSIAGGADAALFTIDIMTGELSFTDAPDFEAPGDADGNNIYEVTVQATNGTLTDEQTMAVTVTDESGEPINFSGTYLVGDAQPVYKKLSDVAAALNNPANTVTGNVVFELDSDYDGTTGETFPITFNQFNNPLLSTVTIRPKDGVSMRMTAGDPGTNNTLILLDGVDYLQLDGRAGGEGSTINWTIRNKRTAASIGSAIRLQNDATMNRLDYLQLEANPTDASQAVVVLGSTNGSQGNDNNVVSYCNIRNRSDLSPSSIGAGNMVAGILSANTTGVESSFNSGNGFYSNNIFNFFCAADSSFGVNLWSGTTN
ncbi:MAG: choice-of-anchor J domain-containing protein, partial [Chitinophagaceae bacterium]